MVDQCPSGGRWITSPCSLINVFAAWSTDQRLIGASNNALVIRALMMPINLTTAGPDTTSSWSVEMYAMSDDQNLLKQHGMISSDESCSRQVLVQFYRVELLRVTPETRMVTGDRSVPKSRQEAHRRCAGHLCGLPQLETAAFDAEYSTLRGFE